MVKRIRSDADILRQARKRIAAFKSDTVCQAIDKIRFGTVQQKTNIKRWIETMLQGYSSYGRWLRATDYDVWQDKLKVAGGMREGRLQWLDWMIAQCEKESQHG